jgi:hypothetical protein
LERGAFQPERPAECAMTWATVTAAFPLAANSGQYFATGAWTSSSPRSASRRAVRAVMVLVVE